MKISTIKKERKKHNNKNWRIWVSIPVPPACKAGTLPFELIPHTFHKLISTHTNTAHCNIYSVLYKWKGNCFLFLLFIIFVNTSWLYQFLKVWLLAVYNCSILVEELQIWISSLPPLLLVVVSSWSYNATPMACCTNAAVSYYVITLLTTWSCDYLILASVRWSASGSGKGESAKVVKNGHQSLTKLLPDTTHVYLSQQEQFILVFYYYQACMQLYSKYSSIFFSMNNSTRWKNLHIFQIPSHW